MRPSAWTISASSRRRPTKDVCSGRRPSLARAGSGERRPDRVPPRRPRPRPPAASPAGASRGGEQVPVEPPGRRLGVGGVLLGQRLAEPVERRQGLVPAAARGQGRHQRPVRALVEGVGGGHGADDVDHLGVLAPRRTAPRRTPPAARDGVRATPRVAPRPSPRTGPRAAGRRGTARPPPDSRCGIPGLPGPPAGGVEGVGVEPRHGALRQQHDVVAQTAQGAGRPAQHPAGHVQRLVQVVGGRRGVTLGPQHGHQRLAVHPMPAGQGQQLDQRLGLAQPPGVGGHQAISHGDLEPTEKTDPHACVVSHCPAPPRDRQPPTADATRTRSRPPSAGICPAATRRQPR